MRRAGLATCSNCSCWVPCMTFVARSAWRFGFRCKVFPSFSLYSRPRVQRHKGLQALNTSPPRNRFTRMRRVKLHVAVLGFGV
jgi:hypothetical protein